jgi:hypothetical protein
MDKIRGTQLDIRLNGAAAAWDEGLVGQILTEEFFGAATPETVYRGLSWTARYKGVRSDAALYLGAGVLR